MDVFVAFDENNSKEYSITINGRHYPAKVGDELDTLLQKMGMRDKAAGTMADVKAPMPGLVLDILVKEGDVVEKGNSLIVLEAMKMENVIKASGNGTVRSIRVKKRDAVEKNQLLIEMT
jgi:biotin carboxyl carrier protein